MKIAISVPDDVFRAGEHLARQLGLSRSQLYRDALAAYLSARGAEAVMARLNAVYATQTSRADPALARTQHRCASGSADSRESRPISEACPSCTWRG